MGGAPLLFGRDCLKRLNQKYCLKIIFCPRCPSGSPLQGVLLYAHNFSSLSLFGRALVWQSGELLSQPPPLEELLELY